MRRLRHDLDRLTTLGLLVAAILTGATGVVADAWDLNDFWPHVVVGYLMGALAVVHVWFNWGRLVRYLQARFRHRPVAARLVPGPSLDDQLRVVPATREAQPGAESSELGHRFRALFGRPFSRRGLIGLVVGGALGVVAGRGLRPPPPIPHGTDLGYLYHEWSKPGLIDALGTVASWGSQPELYKVYVDVPRIPLPEPSLDGGLSAARAIALRRSVRTYAPTPMTLSELSRLLFLASGISTQRWGSARRTAPSSGALYPLELYPVVHNVTGLDRGIYHYAYREHALEQLRLADLRQTVVEQGIGQEFLGQCAVVIFITLILQRMRFRYQDRSYRYGLLEAGHVGQNVYLAATSMGLGACAVGAFMDDAINAMLGIDGREEAAIYMLAVGHVPQT
jgi:SagB-type dehydrogenase family enzyme